MNYLFQQILALVLFLLFLPLYLLTALLCALLNGMPVFYRARRQGLNKKLFTIWKFRTMSVNADEVDSLPDSLDRILSKRSDDPRISAFGHILRRFSIDELPQLWNVMRGEMALVGPRPITELEESLYGKYSDQLHSVKPGMTGLWQISGRNLTTYRRRIAINRYYVRHRSWRMDLWILWKTVDAVISGRGAY